MCGLKCFIRAFLFNGWQAIICSSVRSGVCVWGGITWVVWDRRSRGGGQGCMRSGLWEEGSEFTWVVWDRGRGRGTWVLVVSSVPHVTTSSCTDDASPVHMSVSFTIFHIQIDGYTPVSNSAACSAESFCWCLSSIELTKKTIYTEPYNQAQKYL